MAEPDKLSLISNIASSYLRRNSVSIDQIGTVISSVTRAIEDAAREIEGGPPEAPQAASTEEKQSPAVPVDDSVKRQYIVCLEDGRHVRTLKRHLQVAHGMTPAQYREKWALPKDYPMAAPAYSEHRSQMAKQLGLGRKAPPAERRPGAGRRTRK